MPDKTNNRPQLNELVDQWFDRTEWVHAIGLGPKIVGGRTIEQNSLVFFVTEKLANDHLDGQTVIPKWVEIEGLGGPLPTDVVPMPPFSFSCTHEAMPQGGNCIAPLASPSVGTLGAVLKRRSDGRQVILSASHTMRGIGGTLPSDQEICHPTGSYPPIAKVIETTDWSTSATMEGDAALAEALPGVKLAQTVAGISGPLGAPARPVEGTSVRFRGRNGLKTGKILWTSITVKVGYIYHFANTFLIDALAEKGDSGAVVVNDFNEPLGIVFADNGVVTACTDITAVATKLSLGDYQF